MSKILLVLMVSFGIAMVSGEVSARRGADDPAGHVRQGRGADDPAAHVSQEDRRADRQAGASTSTGSTTSTDVRQCRGCDDPAGHVRHGHGADDGPNHQ